MWPASATTSIVARGSDAAIRLAPYSFVGSKGNVVVVANESATGWSATVTNPSVTSTGTSTCAIKIGSAAAPNPAVTQDGVPTCY